jgi:hypothetical protein
LESWIDYDETSLPAPEQISRHVMLSTTRGVITELEILDAPGQVYLIRYRSASEGAGKLLETGSWIGFRYRDAHWSFVQQ